MLLLGCQEQGAGPVGPEFDKKGRGDCAPKPHNVHCHDDDDGGGGGGGEAVQVNLEGSMSTVNLDATIGNNLGANNNDFMHTITMQFTSPDNCDPIIFKSPVTTSDMNGLKAELDSDVTSGHFTMQIYDDDPERLVGLLLIKRDGYFDDSNSGSTTILFSTNIEGTEISQSGGSFVWTGPVEVEASGVGGRSGAWGYRKIQCSGATPYQVTATINR